MTNRHVHNGARREVTAKVTEVGIQQAESTGGQRHQKHGQAAQNGLFMFVHCFYMGIYISLRVYV